ncbi:MAG: hypothetical protein WKF50_01285 [Nocardioides sp.]
MDEVTWAALTTVLTALGAAWTWYAFRHRGAASGVRGAGLTLVPAAAFLTGTLEMFTEIGGSVLDWATSLVLNPMVWAGIVLAGLSVLLLGSSTMLRNRGLGGKPGDPGAQQPKQATAPRDRAGLPSSSGRGEPAIAPSEDPDLADIEAILKRRGIS